MSRAHPENQTLPAWTDLLETMEEAMEISADTGLALAIEPEPGNVVSDARRAPRARRKSAGAGSPDVYP
jgi:sugar phosphate isomerase/epimerase